MPPEPPEILQPGRNVWRRARAGRLAWLIDAAPYARAFLEAAEQADEALYILGWDLESRLALVRDDDDPRAGLTLRDLLEDLVRRKPRLHVHLLVWDYAAVYAPDREVLQRLRLDWSTHARIHYHLDDHHPTGASHHQKVVVFDDVLAFAGGIDLSKERWDTPAHEPDDPRRRDLDGQPYPPFHDVSVAVDGAAARALGALARERWRLATGQVVSPPTARAHDLWPESVRPDLTDVEVGVARTLPACGEQEAVAEIEQLHLDAIAAARHAIYLENQFLSSERIAEALVRRLEEPDGPQVLVVTARDLEGWLEQLTERVARHRVTSRLREAAAEGRLRIVTPVRRLSDGLPVKIHSKVSVIDDQLAQVGSANLTNRSLGLDTECDLVIEARGDPRVARAVRGLRDRLVAEHLGVAPDDVAQAIDAEGALLGGVARCEQRPEARPFAPLADEVSPWLDALLPGTELIDPGAPLTPRRIVQQVAPPMTGQEPSRMSRKAIWWTLGVAAFLALAAAWRLTPLAEWLEPTRLAAQIDALDASAWAPLVVLGAYVVSGLLFIPLTLLIVATAIAFDLLPSVALAMAGSLLSGLASYAVGRGVGAEAVARVTHPRVREVARWVGARGTLAVALVRVLPIAPFAVVNLVAGATRVRVLPFVVGSFIGLVPGILAVNVFEASLEAIVADPNPLAVAVAVLVVVLVLLGLRALRRALSAHGPGREGLGDHG